MRNFMLLGALIAVGGISNVLASDLPDDHNQMVLQDGSYKAVSGHCPNSDSVREALRTHSINIKEKRDFTFIVDGKTWEVTNIQNYAPSGTTFDEILSLPLGYGGSGGLCIAQFSKGSLNYLAFHLSRK